MSGESAYPTCILPVKCFYVLAYSLLNHRTHYTSRVTGGRSAVRRLTDDHALCLGVHVRNSIESGTAGAGIMPCRTIQPTNALVTFPPLA